MHSFSQILELAMQHYQAGDLRQAELLYRQVLQIDSRQIEALHRLGVIALQVGRPEAAIEYIRQVLWQSPEFVEAHYHMGNALHGLGKLEEAVARACCQ